MQIKLAEMLSKLAELTGNPLPGDQEISEKSGVELKTLRQLQLNPRTSIQTSELQKIVKYLFEQFKALEQGVGDKQLLDRIRYELLDFQLSSLPLDSADLVEER